MALIGNYTLLNKSSTRFFGGSTTSTEVQVRSNFNRSGPSRNMFTIASTGETRIPNSSYMEKFASVPNGYRMLGWIPPFKGGGMQSGFTLAGSSLVSQANLAGGYDLALPSATLAIMGSGTISNAGGNLGGPRTSAITGSGTVSTASIIAKAYVAGALVGSGRISFANLGGAAVAIASLTGSGRISSASMIGAISAIASLTGSGRVSFANLAGKLEALASLVGSGKITPIIRGAGILTVSMLGSGRLNLAPLLAKGWLTLSLQGSGYVTNTIRAGASISSDITVTGDLLTSANVGGLVWAKIAEGAYSVEDLLKIIAAATAGESSGGPGSPIFRNIADTKDRISGTADSSGNRTAITYSPEN